jgi:glycerol-3-phosphate dehydrogenase
MVIERMYPETHSDHSARTEDLALKEDPLKDFSDCQRYTGDMEKKCLTVGLAAHFANYLVHNYGKDSSMICAGMSRYTSQPAENALILSELDFCVQQEMVIKPLDYLMRRSGRLFFMPESIELVENLIFRYFADRMGFEQESLDQERLRWQEVVQSIKSFN